MSGTLERKPTRKSKKSSLLSLDQMSLFDFRGLDQQAPVLASVEESVELAPPAATAELPPPKEILPPEPKIYSVSELSTAIKDTLRQGFGTFAVQGEICDFKGIHRNGHLYCGLKDENSQIRMVMWKGALQRLPFEVRQGLEVVVTGKLDFYGGSGSLQINAERLEPLGIGALQLRFEQLKEKLQKEGLFDLARKRTLQPVNWRVGIVTGRSTAALQDMLRIFRQRFPLTQVYLFHAAVQGKTAHQEIIAGIRMANSYSEQRTQPLDVLIVGRGGGSYEDLFCFNDEQLARAIAGSKIPVVSAVGHEIDFTIADFVADRRAATPSHAVQEVVPDAALWIGRLSDIEDLLKRRLEDLVGEMRVRVDHLYERLIQAAPHKKLEHQRELLKGMIHRLVNSLRRRVDSKKSELKTLASTLEALSPLKSFDRGWALVSGPKGQFIQKTQDVNVGDKLKIRLKNGHLVAVTESIGSDKKSQ